MDIDVRTALSERLGRALALSRSIESAELEKKDVAHLFVMLENEIEGALRDMEVSDA